MISALLLLPYPVNWPPILRERAAPLTAKLALLGQVGLAGYSGFYTAAQYNTWCVGSF